MGFNDDGGLLCGCIQKMRKGWKLKILAESRRVSISELSEQF